MATSKAEAAKAEAKHWYVMRDLTRHNARRPAHVMLKELGIRYFTPMTWRANLRGGRRIRERVPPLFAGDLPRTDDSARV